MIGEVLMGKRLFKIFTESGKSEGVQALSELQEKRYMMICMDWMMYWWRFICQCYPLPEETRDRLAAGEGYGRNIGKKYKSGMVKCLLLTAGWTVIRQM